MTVSGQDWWKSVTVYQIYPATFQDSNGDGIGDIPGIQSRLDYLKDLGVDVIWVSPVYESPMFDMGYDVSNYERLNPTFGTLQDMDNLISACHERGLRLIMDLVINHTSYEHAWFKESRLSKDSPKRDWYIWKPARYDADGKRQPPNNWRSCFNGSAWTWDEATQEYYLHLFCPEQPDLNWENEETRAAIYKSAIEFWLERGVDGFRIDTVNMYSKQPGLPDATVTDPSAEWQLEPRLFCNGPKIHDYMREMAVIFDKYNAMTVGELSNTPHVDDVRRYVSAADRQLNMVFQFNVIDLGYGKKFVYDTVPRNWKLSELKEAVWKTQELINGTDAWATTFMENHDRARSISRYGNDATPETRDKSGKMLAMLVGTLSGTLFIYQGQEIGMVNIPKEWPISEYKDIDAQNYYNLVRKRTNENPEALQEARVALQHLARDNARTPMQWDGTTCGGFSTNEKSWMRINDSFQEINVQKQEHDPTSLLAFWKTLLKVRKEYQRLLVHGTFEELDHEHENILAFRKIAGSETAVVVLNFSDDAQAFEPPKAKKVLLQNYDELDSTKLQPWEGRVYLSE